MIKHSEWPHLGVLVHLSGEPKHVFRCWCEQRTRGLQVPVGNDVRRLTAVQLGQDRSECIGNEEANPVDHSGNRQQNLAEAASLRAPGRVVRAAFLRPQARNNIVSVNEAQRDQGTRYAECPRLVS